MEKICDLRSATGTNLARDSAADRRNQIRNFADSYTRGILKNLYRCVSSKRLSASLRSLIGSEKKAFRDRPTLWRALKKWGRAIKLQYKGYKTSM